MSVDHATERSYVRSQIEAGRNPAELHKLVDDVVASVLREAPGKRIKAQSVERQRDGLFLAACKAADHLRPAGAYGQADEVVFALDEATGYGKP